MAMTLEPADRTACDREPIHQPGSIQPHGVMLIADCEGLSVRHAAGEVEQILGIADWHMRPLNVLIGDGLTAEVAALAESGGSGGFVGQYRAATGQMMDVSAHRSLPYLIVELEAASTEGLPASRVTERLESVALGFEQAPSVAALCDRAAVEFRRLTGYDRVMVLRLLDDDTGCVVAEDRRDSVQSLLHHYFPGSDIPSQARLLYLRNLARVIPDTSYTPFPLRPEWSDSLPLDMSNSGLRSVSPIHLQYLANMGVGASASFSIVKDGALWGLIACHNETPRPLTYDVRAAGRSLAASLARQIKAKDEAEGYRQGVRLRAFEDDIVRLISRSYPLAESLNQHLDAIRRMMDADGAAILRGNTIDIIGTAPDVTQIRTLAAWVSSHSSDPVFATDRLSALHTPAQAFHASGAGVLMATLSTDEPWLILWFRGEQVETIRWAGDPHKPIGSDQQMPLSPRASFKAWIETVRGRARGWSPAAIEAVERLRLALLEAQRGQRMCALNQQLTKVLQDKQLLLQQQEFLIGEVNHRVQNSLMVVSSFIGMQARASNNTEVQDALEEARRRLMAVALVHRRLYRGDQFQNVDIAHYIEELCADTFSFMGQDWKRHLTLDLAPITVSTDRAVTLGLLLTELIINSNKHAYAGEPGPIEITLVEDRMGLQLAVADKGAGKVADIQGFGSRIVKGLIGQLSGQVIYSDNGPGLRTTITVPHQGPPQAETRG